MQYGQEARFPSAVVGHYFKRWLLDGPGSPSTTLAAHLVAGIRHSAVVLVGNPAVLCSAPCEWSDETDGGRGCKTRGP